MTLIASGVNAEDYDYIDTVSGYEYNIHREFYYALEPVYETDSSTGTYIGPTTVAVIPDKFAKAARRHQNVGFRLTGKPVAILKKRTFGTFCSCFDSTLGRRTQTNCADCYDTSFDGGYFNYIIVSGIISSPPRKQMLLEWGSWQPMDAMITLESYPVVAPDDIVVDRLNRRWKIIEVKLTSKALAIVTQNAHIRMIPKDDIIYSFTVPDLSDYG